MIAPEHDRDAEYHPYKVYADSRRRPLEPGSEVEFMAMASERSATVWLEMPLDVLARTANRWSLPCTDRAEKGR